MISILRKLRKTHIKNATELDHFMGNDWDKWYVEKNFKASKVFRYLLFLRMKKVNLNKFFDEIINEKNEKK